MGSSWESEAITKYSDKLLFRRKPFLSAKFLYSLIARIGRGQDKHLLNLFDGISF